MGRNRKVISKSNSGKSKLGQNKKTTQPTKKDLFTISFNENFFRALIEHNSNAITLLNNEGVVIYDSPAANGMLGYGPTEWIGKSVFEIIHPDDSENIKTLFTNLLQQPKKFVQATFRLRHKNNSWIWIEARATNFLAQKDINAIVVNYHDVTERQQIEEALASSEKNFRSLIENSSDWFIKIDSQGVINYVSDPMTRNLGYTIEEFVGKKIFDFIHPQDIPITQSLFAQLLQNPTQIVSAEYRLKHKDNSWRWIESVGKNLFDDPDIRAVIGNFRDITERKQAEDALRASEIKFSSAFQSAPLALAITTLAGQFIETNQAFCELIGYAHEEIVGKTAIDLDLLTQESREKIIAVLKDSDGTSRNVEVQFRVRDGSLRDILYSLETIYIHGELHRLSTGLDITEIKKAQEHIRYQANLLQNVSDAIIASDINFNITTWNPAAQEIYGWTAEEVIGKSLRNFLQSTYENITEEQVLKQFLQEGEWNGEVIHQRKDGTKINILASVSLIKDSTGAPTTMLAVNRDITERKQAEKKLQWQNQRLRVLREIDMAILAADSVENIVRAALDHIRELIGCQRANVALIDWEKEEASNFVVSNAKGTDILQTATIPLSLIQNTIQILLQNQPLVVNNLKNIVDPPPQMQILIDQGLQSMCNIPLFSQNRLIGSFSMSANTVDFFDEEKINLAREVANQVAIAITQNGLINELQELNAKLEQRVTERTAELNKTNVQLEHANRIKDEFLANMSHELRTPLNSILGLSEYLLEQYQDTLNETQQKSLQIIEASGRHLLDLINDVLDLSKMQAGKFDYYPQLVNVPDLCTSSIIFVKSQATKKTIDLRFKIEKNISDFYADPRRLKQILINLLTNAVKFTPNEGIVTLKVNTNAEKNVIQFSVIDTGIGIAPEDLRRLFTPFVQVESSLNRHFEGTGLGLALVQKLTDLHGGSVEVESEVGKGSRFTIKLPYQGNILGQTNEAEKYISHPLDIEADFQPKTENNNQKILLVEDNPANILTIGEYLENHGYQIVIANDGVQAIEKANEIKPDIILMDIQMPVMDGLEAIRRLHADPQFASVPIIALTALAMPGDREQCLEAGASEYMSKPVSLKELKKVIENFLDSPK